MSMDYGIKAQGGGQDNSSMDEQGTRPMLHAHAHVHVHVTCACTCACVHVHVGHCMPPLCAYTCTVTCVCMPYMHAHLSVCMGG